MDSSYIPALMDSFISDCCAPNRLICRPDEQDPALVFLGRRSFGGFNVVHETAYEACARAISSGLTNLEEAGDDEHGISDMEMASR